MLSFTARRCDNFNVEHRDTKKIRNVPPCAGVVLFTG